MRCQDIRQELSAYLDGVLDSEKNKIVAEHLLNCHKCRSYWQALQADAQLLRGLPEMTPLPGFRTELLSKLKKLEKDEGTQKGGRSKVLPFVSGLAKRPWFAGIAVAALIFVFGLTTFGDELSNFISPDGIYRVGNTENINRSPGRAGTGEESELAQEPGVGDPGNNGPAGLGDGGIDNDFIAPGADYEKDNTGSQDGFSSSGENSPGDNVQDGADSEDNAAQPGGKTGDGNSSEEVKAGQNDGENTSNSGVLNIDIASGDEIKIIRKVQMEITAQNVDRAVEGIKDIARYYGGFVQEDNFVTEDGLARVELSVPVVKLHRVVRDMEQLGQVNELQNENKDVTEKYNNLVNIIQELAGEENLLNEQLAECPEDQKIELQNKVDSVREQIKEKRQEKELMEENINKALVIVTVKL